MTRSAQAFLGAAAFALSCSGISCAMSSAQYVAQISDTPTTWGEITSLEGISSDKLEETADGVAITINDSGHVTLGFSEKPSRRIPVKAGDILVFGSGRDWILQPFGDETAVTEDEPAPPDTDSDSDG